MNSSISTQPEKPWDSAAHGFTTLGGCKSHRCFPQWWHVCVSAGAEGEQPNGHVNNTTEVRVFLRRNYTNVLNPLQLSVSVSPWPFVSQQLCGCAYIMCIAARQWERDGMRLSLALPPPINYYSFFSCSLLLCCDASATVTCIQRGEEGWKERDGWEKTRIWTAETEEIRCGREIWGRRVETGESEAEEHEDG